jgi:hypothetical protein
MCASCWFVYIKQHRYMHFTLRKVDLKSETLTKSLMRYGTGNNEVVAYVFRNVIC